MMYRVQLFVVLAMLLFALPLQAAGEATLKATILDVAGNPVDGVKIFVYDSADTRRPADFISPMSGREGRIVLQVPPGRYWVVARLKRDGTYGPLMPGDKHSGEPTMVELVVGEELASDFVVADIQDVGRKRQTVASESLAVTGRIIDKNGAPVAKAYVYALRAKEGGAVPDFLSAWSDGNGRYTLFLPTAGSYYVGAATRFPPETRTAVLREIRPAVGKTDIVMDVPLAVQ